MANDNIEDSVRERLILASLRELEEHGARDFSLRRVASAAGVSCAAPYRHFADKEELILATVAYVREGWELLSGHISTAYDNDPAAELVELTVAGVHFWIANGDFRSVLLYGTASGTEDMSLFAVPIKTSALKYAKSAGMAAEMGEKIYFAAVSMLYGTIMMVSGGLIAPEQASMHLRSVLSELLWEP